MSTSADLVRIAIVVEEIYGVTPDTPNFLTVRTTGEGLAFAPTTTKSNEMNALRMVTDSILTGGSVTGDINFEMAHEEWFDELLAGAFCNEWADNDLKIGTSLKSFTVEKTIPVPGGTTQYHRYAGCTVNGFSFDVKPNAAITGSFTMLGKGVTIDEAELAGAVYTDPFLTPVMTAPRVVGIEIGGVPAVSQCFNNLQIAMNNNNRAIECIGTLGAKELALGRCEVTATFGVLFSDSTLLQALLDQIETSLAFETTDSLTVGSPAANNSFTWFCPRVKFSANPVVAGGTGQDVVNAVVAEGLLDTTTGTSFEVTRSDLVHGSGSGGTPTPGDSKPRFGLGAADAYLSPQTLLDAMADVVGGVSGGRAGTFNLTTTSGNYGWVAVKTSAVAAGMHFFDGIGFGGWSGAGLVGNNTGASPDPTTSTTTFTDGDGVAWTLFRQDFVNANPTPGGYTLS